MGTTEKKIYERKSNHFIISENTQFSYHTPHSIPTAPEREKSTTYTVYVPRKWWVTGSFIIRLYVLTFKCVTILISNFNIKLSYIKLKLKTSKPKFKMSVAVYPFF